MMNQTGTGVHAGFLAGSPPCMRWVRTVALGLVVLLAGCENRFGEVTELTSPNGEQRGSFGWSVAEVGDVDGDGVRDAAVGAPGETTQGQPFGGHVYLVRGTDGGVIASMASPNPQMRGFFGSTVSGVGDVNKDGADDLVVGAHRERVGDADAAGRVYLVSGAETTVLETLVSPEPTPKGFFGTAVDGIGDVDGDGTPDLVVGASDETVEGQEKSGRAYLFSGADGTVLDTLTSPNAEPEGFFGTAVAGVGDLTGDDRPDVVVGAHYETVEDKQRAGRAYVYDGASGALVHTLTSPSAGSESIFGGSVQGIGDVNGDGGADFVVGAYYESVEGNRRAGRAYVMSGRDGTALATLTSPNAAQSGLFGRALASIPDANGDGTPDLLVGAPGERVSGQLGAGHAYVISGADGSVLREFASPNAQKDGAFGGAVGGLGPAEATGRPKVLVGAFWETMAKKGDGRVYLFGQ